MFIANNLIEYVGLREVHKIKDIPVVIVKIKGDIDDSYFLKTETEFKLAGEYAEENLDALKKIVKAFKEYKTTILSSHLANKDINEACNVPQELEKLFDCEFLEFPFIDDRRCHTVESVEFFYRDENGTVVELEVI